MPTTSLPRAPGLRTSSHPQPAKATHVHHSKSELCHDFVDVYNPKNVQDITKSSKDMNKNSQQLMWSQLSLKTIPLLQDEVNLICSVYRKAPSEALYQHISFRADELQAFYLDNEEDSRSKLIERMRIRLLEALQSEASAKILEASFSSNPQHSFHEESKEDQDDDHVDEDEDKEHEYTESSDEDSTIDEESRLSFCSNRDNHNKIANNSCPNAGLESFGELKVDATGPSLKVADTFMHEYASFNSRPQSDGPTMSSPDQTRLIGVQDSRMASAQPSPASPPSSKPSQDATLYPWERRQRIQGKAQGAMLRTRLDPSQEADLVAALSYAAAHQSEVNELGLPFTSPFAKAKLMQASPMLKVSIPKKDQELTDQERNGKYIAKFTIKLTKAEYFEVMRRREVIQARKKAQLLLARQDAKHRDELFRCQEPYEAPLKRELNATLRHTEPAKWLGPGTFAI